MSVQRIFYILLYSLYIVYYSYSSYIFYQLDINSCKCKKLESFKNDLSFRFLFFSSIVLLFFNVHFIIKKLKMIFSGGNNDKLYYTIVIALSLGYGFTFLFDYVLLNFFTMMDEQQCPCQKENRDIIRKMTYVKSFTNICLYCITLYSLNDKVLAKMKKKLKSKLQKEIKK